MSGGADTTPEHTVLERDSHSGGCIYPLSMVPLGTLNLKVSSSQP